MSRGAEMVHVRRLIVLISAFALAGTLATGGAAHASTLYLASQPLLHENTAGNCVSPGFAHTVSGRVTVASNGTSTNISVYVSRGVPRTTYLVNIRCVGTIGTLTTNVYGVGSKSIAFRGVPSFPFDVDLDITFGSGVLVAGPFSAP